MYAVLPPLHGRETVLLGARALLQVTPRASLRPWRVGAAQAASRPALVPGGAPCSSAVAAAVPSPRRELGLPAVCFFLRMPLSPGSSGPHEPPENARSSSGPRNNSDCTCQDNSRCAHSDPENTTHCDLARSSLLDHLLQGLWSHGASPAGRQEPQDVQGRGSAVTADGLSEVQKRTWQSLH